MKRRERDHCQVHQHRRRVRHLQQLSPVVRYIDLPFEIIVAATEVNLAAGVQTLLYNVCKVEDSLCVITYAENNDAVSCSSNCFLCK